MNTKWVSPISKKSLAFRDNVLSDSIREYCVLDGDIPDLIHPQELLPEDSDAQSFYEGRADQYEAYLHLTFQTYGEDEIKIRSQMIDRLNLMKDSRVLEIACGTGRDSVLIEDRLGDDGELFLTDISLDMLRVAKQKLANSHLNIEYCLSNAMHIPCPDNYFDAVYSFGALGEFSDPERFFKEIVRVCKPGAKVVVGDENLPIWQRKTLFGKILANYNKQFLCDIPFASLPIEARDVRCQWIIGGVFYLLDFEVGEGEPFADFDFEIPGVRGGTHKTRYYGQLEGVTPETLDLAWKARAKLGLSMHEWIDGLVRREAEKVLKDL